MERIGFPGDDRFVHGSNGSPSPRNALQLISFRL